MTTSGPLNYASIRLVVSAGKNASAPVLKVEKMFSEGMTIAQFKEKQESFCGIPSQSMQLVLFDANDRLISNLDQLSNSLTLQSLGLKSYDRIHIIEQNCNPGERSSIQLYSETLNDEDALLNSVPKFEISEEAYAQRTDSFRAWKANNVHLLKSDQNSSASCEIDSSDVASSFSAGDRCVVTLPSEQTGAYYFGTIRIVTPLVENASESDLFYGVELNKPVGKHDGVFKNVRYFSTKPNCAVFLKRCNVFTAPLDDDCLMDEL